MKIITANVNGIRAANKKGFFQWLDAESADIVCLQETKAQEHQLDAPEYYPEGYHCHYFDAQKKGYSGVAIYSRQKPDLITRGLGEGFEDMDAEGRFIQADFTRDDGSKFSVISLYLPSGSSKEERQQIKMSFLARFEKILKAMRRKRREFVICGDWNIVHKEIDIKNWKSNQKNSGCLPEERAWLDQLFGPMGFVDAFRVDNQEASQYTWWSNRGQSWANNVGWRIDYQVVTPGLKDDIKSSSIYKDERFSDHAPLIIKYK
ncbi:MAG: exodeoxyribonuclease III [Ectothiorhodospiraceae bacterium]|nr:exodeoxyribonuclease III [Ectothiorhodospiraceae bacterium]